jgi:ComF family protein
MPALLRHAIDACVGALLAPACAACGRIVERTGEPVCCSCWSAVRVFTPPFCTRCGDPLPSLGPPSANLFCTRCATHRSIIARARALGPYEGTLRAIVHSLKYRGRRSTALRLGALLRLHCADVLTGADALVPVPLHYRRHWTRGFNQADEIARAIGPPVWHVLRRHRATQTQTGLTRSDRVRNVRGKFALTLRARAMHTVRGATLVLVDDVSTTGATLDTCARVLLEDGVAEVRAITVARVLAGDADHP